MADKLLTAAQVVDRIGFSRQHLARMEHAGEFPQRIRIGRSRVAWSEADIETWLASRPRGPGKFRRSGAPSNG